MRIAVVLFNLGGPDSLGSVKPFLRNLFSDPAILPFPTWVRWPLARMIAKRRAPVAKEIYRKIGGRSPLLEETEAQATKLEEYLARRHAHTRVFTAMRAWHPRSDATVRAVAKFGPEMIVLLPLYPQFSTTTTASSVEDWRKSARKAGLQCEERRICCYPWDTGFVGGVIDELRVVLSRRRPDVRYRMLLSAHGLPQRTVANGDPYQWQVEKTAEAVMAGLGMKDVDWLVTYQSRIGPQKWLEPTTDGELRRAGRERCGVIVVPISFVSEHSETLVELDLDYSGIARECGVPHYLRAQTVRTNPAFIEGLAALVLRAVESSEPITCAAGRICPAGLVRCGLSGAAM